MYISARTGQIAADLVAATAFALEVAELVEDTTGNPISVWQGTLGTPLGSISWSGQVESFAEGQTHDQKLMENATYLQMIQDAGAAGLFVPGSLDNHFLRVLHAAGTQGPVQYLQAIAARIIPGRQPEALAFAVEVADYASGLLGSPITVCGTNFGEPGTMMFFTGYAGADSVDEALEATMADAGYQERVAKAADVFVDGSIQTTLAKRLR